MCNITCNTCRHRGSPLKGEPCFSCVTYCMTTDGRAFSKWEPEEKKENENGNTENT